MAELPAASPTPSSPVLAPEGSYSAPAILSLIFGIFSVTCGLFCCGGIFTSIPALILGLVELSAIRNGRSHPKNRSFALIGIIFGGLGIMIFLVAFVLNMLGVISQQYFRYPRR